MKNKPKNSLDWIPIKNIQDNLIFLKNNFVCTIIKVEPIYFNLKTDFEQLAILNSYKTFLESINFNLQILIKTQKINIKSNISELELNLENEESEDVRTLIVSHLQFLNEQQLIKQASKKEFYIIVSKPLEEQEELFDIQKYFYQEIGKIKELLSHLGNSIQAVSNDELKEILFSIFNPR